jgi:uncharacterized membrane protein YfcA
MKAGSRGGDPVCSAYGHRFGGLGRLEAQATTLAMMLAPIGLPAVYVYASQQGGLLWMLLVAVGLGFAGGAGLGAVLARRVHTTAANRAYAAFLVLMAFVLAIK